MICCNSVACFFFFFNPFWAPTSKVSISEDAEKRQRVAVHPIVGIRGVQAFQQVSDVAHVDPSFTHRVRL